MYRMVINVLNDIRRMVKFHKSVNAKYQLLYADSDTLDIIRMRKHFVRLRLIEI